MAIWKDIVPKDSNQPETAAGSPPPVNRPRPEVVANTPRLRRIGCAGRAQGSLRSR